MVVSKYVGIYVVMYLCRLSMYLCRAYLCICVSTYLCMTGVCANRAKSFSYNVSSCGMSACYPSIKEYFIALRV